MSLISSSSSQDFSLVVRSNLRDTLVSVLSLALFGLLHTERNRASTGMGPADNTNHLLSTAIVESALLSSLSPLTSGRLCGGAQLSQRKLFCASDSGVCKLSLKNLFLFFFQQPT